MNTGILVLGHGSTLPYNKELVETISGMIADQGDVVVRTAFLNMDKPTLKQGLESFAGTGVDKIVALPIFLAHGVHTMEDIPKELNLNEDKRAVTEIDGKSVDIVYAAPLGADVCIAELAYKRAEEALSR
ncbi:MAG: sirohydrochlorin nickelochelatase [Candidatus Methanogasteraceae archaeon]